MWLWNLLSESSTRGSPEFKIEQQLPHSTPKIQMFENFDFVLSLRYEIVNWIELAIQFVISEFLKCQLLVSSTLGELFLLDLAQKCEIFRQDNWTQTNYCWMVSKQPNLAKRLKKSAAILFWDLGHIHPAGFTLVHRRSKLLTHSSAITFGSVVQSAMSLLFFLRQMGFFDSPGREKADEKIKHLRR